MNLQHVALHLGPLLLLAYLQEHYGFDPDEHVLLLPESAWSLEHGYKPAWVEFSASLDIGEASIAEKVGC